MAFIMLSLNIIFMIILIVFFKDGSSMQQSCSYTGEIEEVYEDIPSCSYTGEIEEVNEDIPNNNNCYEILRTAGYTYKTFAENYKVTQQNSNKTAYDGDNDEEYNRAVEESKKAAYYSNENYDVDYFTTNADIENMYYKYIKRAISSFSIKLNPDQFCFVYACTGEIKTNDHQQIMTQYQMSDDLKSTWKIIKYRVKFSFETSSVKNKICTIKLCSVTLQRYGYNKIGYENNDSVIVEKDDINSNPFLKMYNAYIENEVKQTNLGYFSWCVIERCTEELKNSGFFSNTAMENIMRMKLNEQSDYYYSKYIPNESYIIKYQKYLHKNFDQYTGKLLRNKVDISKPFQFCTYQVCLDELKSQGFVYDTFIENYQNIFLYFDFSKLEEITKNYLEFSLQYLECLKGNVCDEEDNGKNIKCCSWQTSKKNYNELNPVPFCQKYASGY